MAGLDQKYLSLYREYSKAIRAFEIAREKRRRDRASYEARRKLKEIADGMRKPVGAPKDYVPYALRKDAIKPKPPSVRKPTRRIITFDRILGEVIFEGVPSRPYEYYQPDIDFIKLYDRLSLHLYWNARNDYQKRKKAFFDYVRKMNIEEGRKRVKKLIHEEEVNQMLGIEDKSRFDLAKKEMEKVCRNTAVDFRSKPGTKSKKSIKSYLERMEECQGLGVSEETSEKMFDAYHREVERLCRSEWQRYVKSPEPKSDDMIMDLAEALTEAQFAGLDNNDSTVKQIHTEINSLVSKGRLKVLKK